MENVEPIKWNKSQYEQALDIIRNKKKKIGKIKRTNLHELKSNITYDEIQNFSFSQLSKWVDDLRNEIVDLWNSGNPPIIGKSKEDVIKSFKKLKDYPIDNFIFEDKNYPHILGFIRNYTKVPCNQFFQSIILTTIICYYDF